MSDQDSDKKKEISNSSRLKNVIATISLVVTCVFFSIMTDPLLEKLLLPILPLETYEMLFQQYVAAVVLPVAFFFSFRHFIGSPQDNIVYLVLLYPIGVGLLISSLFVSSHHIEWNTNNEQLGDEFVTRRPSILLKGEPDWFSWFHAFSQRNLRATYKANYQVVPFQGSCESCFETHKNLETPLEVTYIPVGTKLKIKSAFHAVHAASRGGL